MAAGRAMTGCGVGGVVEVVREGFDDLLVEPKDIDELARATQFHIKDDRSRLHMGKYGRMFAEQRGWNFVVEKLESLYNEIHNQACDN